jgi:transcriptional regulator with XRE-family HTH domain
MNVSASLISQVELGKATPSVGTLYAMVNELGISLDELFFDAGIADESEQVPAHREMEAIAGDRRAEAPRDEVDVSHPPARNLEPVVRRGERKALELESGVQWERLSPETEHDVDFLYVHYEVGGASCPPDALMRHAGKEYGHLLKGRLGVTVGFETHELEPGDSISFRSDVPHRLFNAGDLPVEAIWFVVGRQGDARVTRRDSSV